MECVREEVRQKSSFRIRYPFNVTDQPQSGTVPHTSHHSIQSHFLKLPHKGLCADPVVSQKHHGFLTAFMGNIHHLLDNLSDFPSLKSLKILKLL